MLTIHCKECDRSFTLSHPAIQSVERLKGVLIQCKLCSTTLTLSTVEAIMESTDRPLKDLKATLERVPNPDSVHISVTEDPTTQAPHPPQTYSGLPQSPLSHRDDLAALRDRLAAKKNGGSPEGGAA